MPAMPDASLFTDNAATIGIDAFALLLIGFSQTAGDARAFATKHRYRIDVNQESVAQGMANAGAGLFQGMPVTTSLSASSLNDSSGARTPLASLTTGACVVLTLLFLAPLFSDLPKPILAAVIIDAVIFGMIDLQELRRLRRVARVDFWIAIAAIVGVLSAGVLAGVVIGVALSMVWLIHVAAKPVIPRIDGPADMIILRLDFGLSFATAEALDDRLRPLLDAEPESRIVVLDFAGVDFIDSQGSEKLGELRQVVGAADATLRIARLKPQIREMLVADGVFDQIGAEHVYAKLRDAVSRTA